MDISKVNELDDAKFKDFVGKSKIALIDFYADWCGPCQALKPTIEELSEEMKGKVAFAKVNIDNNKENAGKFGVMSIPTLVIFKNGKLVDRLIGALPKQSIKQRLEKLID